ncbi:protein terminal ear1 [Ricinus communis]|uniref:protein terminal ear1 n=1 Tax=Ricinus communis TaxID=3988 RepID=UPI00201A7CC1|nr:protein terminal ear1 [Ricinus communis]
MAETGIARFQGSLDPRAQEFRPRNNSLHLNTPTLIHHHHQQQQQQQQQLHIFTPPPPPPPPPPAQQLYYPYAPPPSLGFPQYQLAPPQPQAYISTTVPSLPPQSAAPTRTLVLSSVPTEVSESVIRRELEVFGEVRGVQMERISDGIVTVHFYDLRHAEIALVEIREKHMQQQSRLRNLFAALDQNNFLAPPSLPPSPAAAAAARGFIAGCAVWAQFVIPSCNAVPDGHNHGTIVVFNLDPNVSTSSLKEIFQAFGAVKELRETPLKKQQRFVEFYDIRDAAKALKEMNGKEIHGKQVVIEFSRPGGFGRKFFNGSSTSKASSFHNAININPKISRYAPPPPPPPPPVRPNISPRPFLAQTHSSSVKRSSNSIKGNPNENSNSNKGSIGCLPMSDGDGIVDGMSKKVADGHASKRNNNNINNNNAKKSQNNESSATISTTTKHQNRSRPWKSRPAKKFDTRFLINEDAMVDSNCSDSRTTVMIKNIPNKYSQKLLLNMLDNHCIHCNEQIIAEGGGGDDQPLSSYDFVYLPIDFNNKCNVGYGFVNMTSSQATLRLYKAFHHQHWEVFNSRKICEVTYARVQGLEALREHFKNSKFPCEMDHYLPVVFSPPRDGKQLPEPLPIVGHGQKQPQSLIILGLHMKRTNSSGETDEEDREEVEDQEEEENLNQSSSNNSSQNGCDIGYDDKDSSSGSLA